MKFDQLRYLEAALRTGAFRQAAKELGVAQPTIMNQVQRLEEELGVVLFVRSTHGVRPTEAAHMMLPHVTVALHAERVLREKASSIESLKIGSIRLATVSSASQKILPGVVKRLHLEHPNIRFEVTEGGSEMVIRGVVTGHFDAGLLVRSSEENPDPDHLDCMDILSGRLVLAIPEDHPIASMDVIEASDLSGQSIIHYSRGSVLRPLFDRFLQGVDTRTVYLADSAETAQAMVRAGVGISIANSLSPSTVSGAGVVISPLRGEWAQTRMAAVVRKGEMRGPVVQTLIDLVRQEAARVRRPGAQVSGLGTQREVSGPRRG